MADLITRRGRKTARIRQQDATAALASQPPLSTAKNACPVSAPRQPTSPGTAPTAAATQCCSEDTETLQHSAKTAPLTRIDVLHVDADRHPHQHVLRPLHHLAVDSQQVGALQGLS
jgi:hypothetical protein